MNYLLKEIKSVYDEDADNTFLTYNFFRKYFSKLKMDQFEENESQVKEIVSVRGDTIISFNTIAGAILRLSNFNGAIPNDKDSPYYDSGRNRLLLIQQNADSIPSEVLIKINEFHSIYHSFSNFMPLPRTPFNKINSIKSVQFQDYPDVFLLSFKAHFFDQQSNIFDKINASDTLTNYFKSFNNHWDEFVEELCLQPFFKDDQYQITKSLTIQKQLSNGLFPYKSNQLIEKINHRISNSDIENYKKECFEHILQFLILSIDIIKQRSELLSKKST